MRTMATVFFALVFCSLSQARTIKGTVSSPAAGVICDKKAGFCVDSSGISMGLTKQFLGEKAERKLLAQGEFDMTVFVLTKAVACDNKAQTCTKEKWDKNVGPAHTQALFRK